ncbi:MAG: branched-chain amino acid ABC transporter substrate-binding protein [Sutterellaceae bacterium]|nr:branched-chain amino acid ABC transporter substrate-binding protein [Burkholderiaceae bacterium]MCX7901315.1 branched-chain amino acid ABC transporter substrate-binding protein [Burkholderiaceae bacterium]MDW8429489.1 branched-chain amino acid ABC transporter substrate-binding protein [Sutterellaceae bacterium]
MMRFALRTAAVAVALGTAAAAWAQSETVRIAFIDPQSGLMAPVGTNILRSYQLIAEIANRENWVKGVRFEIVPFDNKLSPQESLNALKAAIDQGIRYITQGNGSSVALALADAVAKHNERNPGKEVVYLNYAAVDPDLTNSKCTFWHFRFDANSDMKMEALTTFMAERKDIKAVYLINQDYSFGHQVRRAAREYLARKRPDIKIVGDELHPLAKVTDFSQYVAKIKASGADTVITGNWGSDLALLIKAAKEAGLNAHFYTYYAGTTGVPTAIGDAGVDRVRFIGYWNLNSEKPGSLGERIYKEFKTRFKDDYYTIATYTVIRALAEAMNKAKSTDPVKVAFALEGLRFQSLNGEVEMRASDHQLQQPLFISSWQKVDGKQVRFDAENTGYGWRTERVLDAFIAAQPTSCNMKRPARPAG